MYQPCLSPLLSRSDCLNVLAMTPRPPHPRNTSCKYTGSRGLAALVLSLLLHVRGSPSFSPFSAAAQDIIQNPRAPFASAGEPVLGVARSGHPAGRRKLPRPGLDINTSLPVLLDGACGLLEVAVTSEGAKSPSFLPSSSTF